MKPRIAIIGAGLAGLTLAQGLRKKADVTVFEKARGVGGRMSTRYADPFYFDHGAQYFTGRSRPFREFLAPFIARGVVSPWEGKVVTLARGKAETDRIWFEPHYVAAPNMNALCKSLAEGTNVITQTEVAPLTTRSKKGWLLKDINDATLGEFDWVVSSAPAPQTARLMDAHLPADHPFRSITLQGCYAVMLGFNRPWKKSWIGAKCDDSPLGWISVNSSKAGRDATRTSLVLHSTNPWAEEHIDDDMNSAQALLLAEFEALTGIDCRAPDYLSTHRWRYALVNNPSKSGFYCDPDTQLAATGDAAVTSRIEEVWFTAHELAEKLRAIILT